MLLQDIGTRTIAGPLRRRLTIETAKTHAAKIRRFLQWMSERDLSQELIREYLSLFNTGSPYTYGNHLKALKLYCRDFLARPDPVQSFRFPQAQFKPKAIPSKQELHTFHLALEKSRDRALLLFYATSKLRRQEVLDLLTEDLSFEQRMIKPQPHNGRTKHAWITLYNSECAKAPEAYLAGRNYKGPKLFPVSRNDQEHLWQETRAKTGISMTPKVLRE